MGSKLGKATAVPAMTARTCGVNILLFCTMVACAAGGGATGEDSAAFISWAETTTPEKSFCLFTASTRESRKTTVPERVAPLTVIAARLKQVSQRQIIVAVQPKQGTQILRPRLRGFEFGNYVWSQLVHDIPCIHEVPLDAVRS